MSLIKRPRGPIEIPPSVQNPLEGRSRSPKVTFQRGNQKRRRRREGSEGATTRRGRASNRSSTALRNATDSKGEEDPTSRQDGEKTPEGRRSSALQARIRVQSVCGSTQKLSCVIKHLSEGGDGHICETLPHLKTTQVLQASILA